MLQRRNGIVQRVQEPVVRDIKRGGTGFKPSVTASASSNGRALFANRLNETFDQKHQLLTGTGSQTCGNELLIIDKMTTAIAKNAREWNRLRVGRQLGFRNDADILLAQFDFTFIDAVRLIAQRSLHASVARMTGHGVQITIKTIVPASRHGEIKRQHCIRGRKDFLQVSGLRWRIGIWQLKGKAVREYAGSMQHDCAPIPDSLLVELKV